MSRSKCKKKKAIELKERIVKKTRMDVDEASHIDPPFHLKKVPKSFSLDTQAASPNP